jgi:hypothetical protein
MLQIRQQQTDRSTQACLDDDDPVSISTDTVDLHISVVQHPEKGLCFVSDDLVSHFFRRTTTLKEVVGDNGSIPLDTLRAKVSSLETKKLDLGGRDLEEYDNLRDLAQFLEDRKPFYRRFVVEHQYGLDMKTPSTRHENTITFCFSFTEIKMSEE